jgi:hypothetical protein
MKKLLAADNAVGHPSHTASEDAAVKAVLGYGLANE